MTEHPVFPINFFVLSYEQFISYMRYRERQENASFFALENDLRAIHMFLRAYGKKPDDWFYKLPVKPNHRERDIPSPDTVHKMITHQYLKNDYTNILYQTLFAHSFWIGWRVPSEICELSVDDVDFDNGSITITETKKHHSRRIVYPEHAVISGKTRKSLKNYYDKWRPKVECNKSGNAFYLTPNGLPFTPRHLGHQLSETGKQVYPKYQPYVSRHWCAVAMLIRTKLETDHFDVYIVKNHLGHDKITTTETYIGQAQALFKKYPFDWIKRTLKFDLGIEGESALKSKQRQNTPVSTGKSGETVNGLSGI